MSIMCQTFVSVPDPKPTHTGWACSRLFLVILSTLRYQSYWAWPRHKASSLWTGLVRMHALLLLNLKSPVLEVMYCRSGSFCLAFFRVRNVHTFNFRRIRCLSNWWKIFNGKNFPVYGMCWMWFGLKPANCVQVRLLNTSTLNTDLHLLYRDVTLAVWARLRPHGAIHILVSPHEQELDVLATLCALDLTVFTDLAVGLQCKHQSRRLVMSNQLLIVHIPYESDSMWQRFGYTDF